MRMSVAETVLAAITPLGMCLTSLASAQVTLHYSERPPYSFVRDDQLSGLIGSPVRDAFKAAGVQYTLALTPVPRQLHIIKSNTGLDCSASGGFKNEERESFAKFKKPIYRDKARIALTSVRNTKIKNGDTIESVLGNKTINLLVKNQYSYGKVLDDLIERLQPARTVVSAENVQMVKMIQAGRSDLMFISQEEADGLIAASDIDASAIRQVRFSDAPEGEYRYVFCSKNVPDEIINRLNAAIK